MSKHDTEHGAKSPSEIISPASLFIPQIRPSQPSLPSLPAAPDTDTLIEGDVVTNDDAGTSMDGMFTGVAPDAVDTIAVEEARHQARQALREFLSAVPRAEAETTITFVRPDGVVRTLSRGQLSAAIDRLRFRQRQSVRWCVEERWPRERVSAALQGVSIRTIQRDVMEALDLLIAL
ncbi:MAG TPA: hypothetical protein VKQ36_12990 [Ktedonobacterales bacterium]|nr:hypothetical protein [Ktedonobacterales bacterium]